MVEAHATAADFSLTMRYLSNSPSKEVNSRTFRPQSSSSATKLSLLNETPTHITSTTGLSLCLPPCLPMRVHCGVLQDGAHVNADTLCRLPLLEAHAQTQNPYIDGSFAFEQISSEVLLTNKSLCNGGTFPTSSATGMAVLNLQHCLQSFMI